MVGFELVKWGRVKSPSCYHHLDPFIEVAGISDFHPTIRTSAKKGKFPPRCHWSVGGVAGGRNNLSMVRWSWRRWPWQLLRTHGSGFRVSWLCCDGWLGHSWRDISFWNDGYMNKFDDSQEVWGWSGSKGFQVDRRNDTHKRHHWKYLRVQVVLSCSSLELFVRVPFTLLCLVYRRPIFQGIILAADTTHRIWTPQKKDQHWMFPRGWSEASEVLFNKILDFQFSRFSLI